MRTLAGAALAATLLISSAFAQDATGPLAAGKPAGVQQAQRGDNTIWYIVGGAAVIAIVAIAASSGGGNNNNNANSASGTSGTP